MSHQFTIQNKELLLSSPPRVIVSSYGKLLMFHVVVSCCGHVPISATMPALDPRLSGVT